MITHLGRRPIGPGHAPYFVAELGPNFVVGRDREANIAQLVRMIDAAASAGVDCVKVQLKSMSGFYADDDLTRPPHDPARAPFATRGDYVRAREPDAKMLEEIDHACSVHGIEWTASVWDAESVELLRRFERPWVKVASACVSDLALLEHVRSLGIPIVMSTGMCTMREVEVAMDVLRRGDVILAQCTAAYPCAMADLNLAAIRTLAERFHVRTGWSSHVPQIEPAGWATAAGARWIEYHVTHDRGAWGPDHASSLTMSELADAVLLTKCTHEAMGDGEKRVLDIEQPARARLRRVGR